ncbi:hypothetical protein [Mycobacterium lacus]|uniref:hypothetical protein n=1 Tax=Mycobacterium lacus TaxID=169765 RepID=UPI00111C5A11|nr:hypothetical protein [Mycobacterium lacus]
MSVWSLISDEWRLGEIRVLNECGDAPFRGISATPVTDIGRRKIVKRQSDQVFSGSYVLSLRQR